MMTLIFIVLTSCNLFLQYKICFTGNVTDSWKKIYVRSFNWCDVAVAAVITVTVILVTLFYNKYVYNILCHLLSSINEKKKQKISQRGVFIFILCIWYFFFLIFYPGTAMNDTIYILQDPYKMSYQHPILYNLYTYGFYEIGCILGNPNWGLALLSITQMIAMDYVLSKAIITAQGKGIGTYICVGLTLYFAFAPLYFTYAFSAIKDTPFTIVMFYFLLFLLEVKDSNGQCLQDWKNKLRFGVCIFILISFRNNGIIIVLGTMVVLMLRYCDWRKQFLIGTMSIIILQKVLCNALMPDGVEPLFQEKIGVPLQQVAAVAARQGTINNEQKEYLYHLMPEEEWKNYAPMCADIIKWSESFDSGYLDSHRQDFVRTWGELFTKTSHTPNGLRTLKIQYFS